MHGYLLKSKAFKTKCLKAGEIKSVDVEILIDNYNKEFLVLHSVCINNFEGENNVVLPSMAKLFAELDGSDFSIRPPLSEKDLTTSEHFGYGLDVSLESRVSEEEKLENEKSTRDPRIAKYKAYVKSEEEKELSPFTKKILQLFGKREDEYPDGEHLDDLLDKDSDSEDGKKKNKKNVEISLDDRLADINNHQIVARKMGTLKKSLERTNNASHYIFKAISNMQRLGQRYLKASGQVLSYLVLVVMVSLDYNYDPQFLSRIETSKFYTNLYATPPGLRRSSRGKVEKQTAPNSKDLLKKDALEVADILGNPSCKDLEKYFDWIVTSCSNDESHQISNFEGNATKRYTSAFGRILYLSRELSNITSIPRHNGDSLFVQSIADTLKNSVSTHFSSTAKRFVEQNAEFLDLLKETHQNLFNYPPLLIFFYLNAAVPSGMKFNPLFDGVSPIFIDIPEKALLSLKGNIKALQLYDDREKGIINFYLTHLFSLAFWTDVRTEFYMEGNQSDPWNHDGSFIRKYVCNFSMHENIKKDLEKGRLFLLSRIVTDGDQFRLLFRTMKKDIGHTFLPLQNGVQTAKESYVFGLEEFFLELQETQEWKERNHKTQDVSRDELRSILKVSSDDNQWARFKKKERLKMLEILFVVEDKQVQVNYTGLDFGIRWLIGFMCLKDDGKKGTQWSLRETSYSSPATKEFNREMLRLKSSLLKDTPSVDISELESLIEKSKSNKGINLDRWLESLAKVSDELETFYFSDKFYQAKKVLSKRIQEFYDNVVAFVLKLSGADATTHADEWLEGKITYNIEKGGHQNSIKSRDSSKKAFVFGFGTFFLSV